jgi:sugar (pentulose or hexulose) kinase
MKRDPARWEWALPSAAAASIGLAAAVQVQGDGFDVVRSAFALGVIILGACLIGAWIVMIGVTHKHDRDEGED